MDRNPQIFQALDLIGQACAESAAPEWQAEWRDRTRRTPRRLPDNRGMMRHFAVAIAYSQGARSSEIRKLVRSSVFARAFLHFDPVELGRKRPETILRHFWHRLGHMRYRGKVARIVGCARVLNQISGEYGSFATYLRSYRIPRRLKTVNDIEHFWGRFDRIQADLRKRDMPFFRSTTSLLQLLLDLDYDSVKPDLIVMRLARRIGMVERETGDRQLRSVARQVQEFAVARGLRAQAIDLELLAFGGQTGSRQLLETHFCPASDPCEHPDCAIGRKGLCKSVLIR